MLSESGSESGGGGGEEGGFALLPRLKEGGRSVAAEFSYGSKKQQRDRGAAGSSSAAPLSRADFLLQCGDERGGELVLEVKSVTLAEDDDRDGKGSSSSTSRLALFPDTVSVRAQRHARDLEEVVRTSNNNRRAAIVFLIQRGDCSTFSPSEACDPEYCRALRSAARAGVLILAVRGEIVVDETKGLLFKYLGRAMVELGEDREEEEEEGEDEAAKMKKKRSNGGSSSSSSKKKKK